MNDLKRYKRIQELLDEGKDPGFTVRESNSEIVWRLWDEAVSNAAILESATKLFPMWREDIQPRFVVEVCRAVLALASAPAAPAQAVPSSCGLTECKNMPKCECCKVWDSMGI